MKIPIVFLGTSQAVPTASRNHMSILLSYKDENILVDCGEGTQRQFRKARINPGKVNRILITHWHGDHVLGLAGLFQTLMLSGYKKHLDVYGPKGTQRFMDELMSPFIPVLKFKADVYEVSGGKVFETPDFVVEAVPLEHGAPCNGYLFREKDKLRINKDKISKLLIKPQDREKISELIKGKDIEIGGKKIKSKDYTYTQQGKKIAFLFDTKVCKNAEKLAKGADLLISESTYSDEDKDLAIEHNHLTCVQAAQIAKKAKAKRLILTHISQRYENREGILVKEAKKVFGNVELSQDFLRVDV
jgi:ribonuclease Z